MRRKSNTRVVKIKVSARGKGVPPESMELTTCDLTGERALELYHAIEKAVHALLR